MITKGEYPIGMGNESVWYVDFEAFFTILKRARSQKFARSRSVTSKQVRMPGHVVTIDALQRLCITHVHTRTETREKGMLIVERKECFQQDMVIVHQTGNE